MQLKEIKGVSKKTGKEFTGCVILIGEYQTPMFFPSKIEKMYINSYLRKLAHKEFKDSDSDELEESDD